MFYNKYRPKSFSTFYGNKTVIETVKGQLIGDIPHSWLITGDTNAGKSTLARIISRQLLEIDIKDEILDHPDYSEINVSINRSIDYMRNLVESMKFRPKKAKYKIIVLDECHKLLDNSASTLLKPLEEPPPHIILILVTNEPTKLLKTLTNRAFRINLEPLSAESIKLLTKRVIEKEKISFFNEKSLDYFAKCFENQPRQALITLEALKKSFKGEILDKSSINSVLITTLENDMLKAIDIIVSLYSHDFNRVCQLSQEFTDINYLIINLLDINHYILSKITGVFTNKYVVYSNIIASLKPFKENLNIKVILAVQNHLLNLKKELVLTNINNPKHVMLVYMAKIILNIRKDKV